MWRWSCMKRMLSVKFYIFSTYVEVILVGKSFRQSPCNFLHVCGGDPTSFSMFYFLTTFSPRMWRWSYQRPLNHVSYLIFSTYVEVIPRMVRMTHCAMLFSPRMWRWSYIFICINRIDSIFSTYVEVIPINNTPVLYNIYFLHVCGGDPESVALINVALEFSPRMWRWSWLSRLSALMLVHFLHVCGGDPVLPKLRSVSCKFSPRMWRWSYLQHCWLSYQAIFSTYVEVIPGTSCSLENCLNFLHVCGGDPATRQFIANDATFSPRMWRWS